MLEIFNEILVPDDYIYDFTFQIDLTNGNNQLSKFDKFFIDCETIVLVISENVSFFTMNTSLSEIMVMEVKLDTPACDYRTFFNLNARVLIDLIRNASGYIKFSVSGRSLKIESLYYSADLHEVSKFEESKFNILRSRVMFMYECRETEQCIKHKLDFSFSNMKKFDVILSNHPHSLKMEINNNDEFYVDLVLNVLAEQIIESKPIYRDVNGKFLRFFNFLEKKNGLFFSDGSVGFFSINEKEDVKKMIIRGINA